jgi:hypothetical protein
MSVAPFILGTDVHFRCNSNNVDSLADSSAPQFNSKYS